MSVLINNCIYHDEGLDVHGKGFTRCAIRAVVIKNKKILMVHSGVNGDYKFPGGGVEKDEDHHETLKREVLEECGLHLSSVDSFLGALTEYSKAQEEELDYFKMESFYYHCAVDDVDFMELNLDDYERDLDFSPKWVDINTAITANRTVLESTTQPPRWTKRELIFLEYLKENRWI